MASFAEAAAAAFPQIPIPIIIAALLVSYYVISSIAAWWRLRAFDSVVAELVEKIRVKYAVDPDDTDTDADSNTEEKSEKKKMKPLLDFAVVAQYFTLDAISQVAWGERLGFLRTESDLYGHMGMLRDLATTQNVASAIPPLAFFASLRWVQTMLAPKGGKNARGIYKILPCVLFLFFFLSFFF